MTEGTILDRLHSQRSLAVDVVRQIDTAIAAFGGTNGNGNGKSPKNGSGGWFATASPQKLARWRKRLSASQRAAKANKKRQQQTQSTAEF